MKGPFVSTSAGLVLLFLASPGWAREPAAAPDALLSGGDRYRQEQTLQNTLEYNRTGTSSPWVNPETGHRGRVTPTLTYRNSAGQDCRKFQRSLTIDGRAAVGHGTRCRTRNGIWTAPQPVYTRRHYYPHYPRPHYPYYRGPFYPVTFHLGYVFGHHRHHGHRHRGHRH